MEPQQEGITRALTPGEVNLARSVFGSTIFYQTVLVHCDSYLPFGLQNQYTAMSPNGELYFRRPLYKRDYASLDPEGQYLFIVWFFFSLGIFGRQFISSTTQYWVSRIFLFLIMLK
ncbi:hypothetical protein [Serratia marcescens]|uniref:hypothetical protein n=1 Tax=Serratia marcescens TaxID=615 RepID=UPI0036D33A39